VVDVDIERVVVDVRRPDEAYEARLVGPSNIHDYPFDIYVHHGAGAYICGRRIVPATAIDSTLLTVVGQP
jgi:NADH:ubiquinone oxidoreductase subunit F (NADH-binding)